MISAKNSFADHSPSKGMRETGFWCWIPDGTVIKNRYRVRYWNLNNWKSIPNEYRYRFWRSLKLYGDKYKLIIIIGMIHDSSEDERFLVSFGFFFYVLVTNKSTNIVRVNYFGGNTFNRKNCLYLINLINLKSFGTNKSS